ncbi:endo-1,4-beta-xylanase [Halosimplex marinum]|uniref:endo-1,4-beta-xylanase n=1 Tax=Halosimplex marinum TaxID=3396620 RepID=UPI003F567E70
MSSEATLRERAKARGIEFGAALSADPLREDSNYWNTARTEFTSVTTSSELKMGPLRPSRKTYDFTDADAIVDFGNEYDMTVRGHTLVWHTQKPDWFQEWDYSGDQVREFLRDHIRTVAGRYGTRIDAWDVVNEGVHEDGSMRESVWYEGMGPEYIEKAFEWADEVTDSDLFYNDYDLPTEPEKADAVYDLLADFLDRGVPVDGVGLQLHGIGSQADPEDVAETVQRFRDLGLDVHLTELDVAYEVGSVPDDPLAAQAEYYRDLVRACVDAGVDSITTWGVNDGNSWVRDFYKAEERFTIDPLLFDRKCDPKPAYYAVKEALAEE